MRIARRLADVPLERNVGGLDRIARGVLGAVLLVAGAAGYLTGYGVALPAVLAVAAAGLLFNAATQFCGVNALLGVDTCSVDAGSE